ncbi:ATP-dependent zinc metalloprotease YME1L1 [Thelohanellus kitauei]|uniref:ATP-dependent zinc metalloprotease YME1L1 n=1 Tax=Thelohanellus kitauei TaxID=669202 RepID=A0A0C2MFT2_THEKT|nr:ATP-dependent zinc metalloprotease YME1L1 [Thelohanellus kitauei]
MSNPAKARANAPCIIFIDELDAVGSKRVESPTAPFSRMTINQLLTEMDGFKDNNIVFIGATNDPKVLDPALVRAGRFDTVINVPLPCFKDRIEIIQYYVDKVRKGPDINVERLASLTPGASGADLANLINQAAVRAVSRRSSVVTNKDVEWARDKIFMGRERKALAFSDFEKKRIADHEAGHAVVAYYTKGARRLHKATIMPRGMSLGSTHLIPERDEYLMSYEQLLASIDVCMGGRAAEELLYGKNQITTGCSSDLSHATDVARKMIANYGFSKDFGLNYFDAEISSSHASDLDVKIHDEVKKILDESYERAINILKQHYKKHQDLSDALVRYETLDDNQISEILT